ncbi:MAG: succinyl-diaminopimelate desuccinylase [Gammaproteobacteria bacterium]|nr:succinyl-diaminopimelate desuccinylase [Gammaproteobacteria bacterium]
MTSAVTQLACELIERRSVTPDDAGCQELITARLEPLGFTCEPLPFADVNNLWATRGTGKPVFCFAGHTDVVPTGPVSQWSSAPFVPTVRDGLLYGRGAADMKGGLAAMVCATERFVTAHPQHRGTLAFLITSDEEGVADNGTRKVMDTLQQRHSQIDHCIVGEPSSSASVGDVVRIGRRGSLSGTLRVSGQQGHVAFPEKADNPIHAAMPALHALCEETWDQGNDHFPATTFQISNITAGTGAENVIPGTLDVLFNLRYSTAITESDIRARTEAILRRFNLQFSLDWRLSGAPFLSTPGPLINSTCEVITEFTGTAPQLSTGGGTSDGRFIAPTGTEVLELGPCNATIHQIDEHVRLADLDALETIYFKILEKLLG